MLIFSMAVVSPFVISFFLKDLYHCWSLQPPLFFISLYTLYTALPALDRFLQTLQAEGSIGESPGKEPRGGVGNFPVAAQQDQEVGRQHEVTILVALALPDANRLAARINVTPLEMKGFRGPQAGGVDGGQQDPVLPLGNGGQETRDFLETQHFGQPAFLAGKGNVLDDPVLVKGVAVEEAQGADRLVKPTPGGFLLMGQKELVGADLFRS